MSKLPEEFVKKIAKSLQEEEVDIFVLNLYYRNSTDLMYFQEKDRKRITRTTQSNRT